MTTYDAKSWISCAFCGKPVELEDAKTNDQNKIVHEGCYVRSIVEEPVEEFGG